jgi:hypothetical protein
MSSKTVAIADIDVVRERVGQAQACIDAINVVLNGRLENPRAGTITDQVLRGLSSAAGSLLRQAEEAAKFKRPSEGPWSETS